MYAKFIAVLGFPENSSYKTLWMAPPASVLLSIPPGFPAVRSATEELVLHFWGLGRSQAGLLGTHGTCYFIFPKCEAHEAWRQTGAAAVGVRVTAEDRPVFISLLVPGTEQSVCSWPNAVPIMPAEIELGRLERSWHVGVHAGDGGRASAVSSERFRAHQDHGA